jgi:energy-coupling factor transporter ATP-binding protein EcfA2
MRSIELVLENVRCFHQRTTINFRPLTLLVGENSAGKTTLMAMLSAVLHRDSRLIPGRGAFPQRLAFDPPYDIGGYDTIATHRSGSQGRAKSFLVGFRYPEKEGETERKEAVAEFRDFDGTPGIVGLSARGGKTSVDLRIRGKFVTGTVEDGPGTKREVKTALPPGAQGLDILSVLQEVGPAPELVVWFFRLLESENVRSLAPARTRPRRTYDELRDEFSPEGDHIPLLLARLWREPNGRRRAVEDMLEQFGRESGLFRRIDVRRLGKKSGDPFQVRVAVEGPSANIPDVGYGISQALPVIVESTILPEDSWLLMQQPEVHLHPKAQAALGTFFAGLVAKGRKGLVVETHSDFLVDRVRQEVANGTINAEDVVIHYLERRRGRAQVHEITLDTQGNLVGVPLGYRQFFIDEEMRLLSRGD